MSAIPLDLIDKFSPAQRRALFVAWDHSEEWPAGTKDSTLLRLCELGLLATVNITELGRAAVLAMAADPVSLDEQMDPRRGLAIVRTYTDHGLDARTYCAVLTFGGQPAGVCRLLKETQEEAVAVGRAAWGGHLKPTFCLPWP